jgi:peroxiredoxin
MTTIERRPPVRPGEPAPDFTLPAANREGSVSLADYRGRSPVLLAMYRGLYCPFCRRHVVQLGTTAEKLQTVGVETLAIVASKAERARFYFRHRPIRSAVGADPELITYRAYGVPQTGRTPEVRQAVQDFYRNLARELKLEVPDDQARDAIGRLDGFEVTESEKAESERHQIQFTAQFLVDRHGIVRWANIECAQEGLAGIDKFPTDQELLAAARALPT